MRLPPGQASARNGDHDVDEQDDREADADGGPGNILRSHTRWPTATFCLRKFITFSPK